MAEIDRELYEAVKKAQTKHTNLGMCIRQYFDNPSEFTANHILKLLDEDYWRPVRDLIYPHFVRSNYDQYADRRASDE